MRRSTVLILLFTALWIAGSVWVAARVFDTVEDDGAIQVRVSGPDGRFAVVLPAFLAVRTLRHARWTCDGNHVLGRNDVAEWAPALRAALTELEAYQDVPLLEIEDEGQLVRMHKHGGRFVLEVLDGRERVKIVMPVRTVRRALADAGV